MTSSIFFDIQPESFEAEVDSTLYDLIQNNPTDDETRHRVSKFLDVPVASIEPQRTLLLFDNGRVNVKLDSNLTRHDPPLVRDLSFCDAALQKVREENRLLQQKNDELERQIHLAHQQKIPNNGADGCQINSSCLTDGTNIVILGCFLIAVVVLRKWFAGRPRFTTSPTKEPCSTSPSTATSTRLPDCKNSGDRLYVEQRSCDEKKTVDPIGKRGEMASPTVPNLSVLGSLLSSSNVTLPKVTVRLIVDPSVIAQGMILEPWLPSVASTMKQFASSRKMNITVEIIKENHNSYYASSDNSNFSAVSSGVMIFYVISAKLDREMFPPNRHHLELGYMVSERGDCDSIAINDSTQKVDAQRNSRSYNSASAWNKIMDKVAAKKQQR